MTHLLVVQRAEEARAKVMVNVMMLAVCRVDGVRAVHVQVRDDAWAVRCTISRWWWALLGLRHLVVRWRVRRSLAADLRFWPDPAVVESVVVT